MSASGEPETGRRPRLQDPGSGSPGWSSYAFARRVAVSVIGGTLIALGCILLLVPGPGILALSMGLGVLALEFAWARRWLRRLRERASRLAPSGSTASRD